MKKPKNKKQFKNSTFKDYNLSHISDLKNQSGKLVSGWNSIPNGKPVSWIENAIPNYLWAILLAGNLPRENTLHLFRSVFNRAATRHLTDSSITMLDLPNINPDDKLYIFEEILKDPAAKRILSALNFLSCLPDKVFWNTTFDTLSDDESIDILIKGVYVSLDHQSQESTDVRWLFLMYEIIAKQKMILTSEVADMLQNFLEYPNKGDMRSVRPMIRSAEMAFRAMNFEGNEKIRQFNIEFWKECFDRTPCLVPKPIIQNKINFQDLAVEATDIYLNVVNNFKMNNSDFDVKREVVYGSIMYAFTIYLEIISYKNSFRIAGINLLRTLVEIYINLKYLTHKQDATLWEKFYKYGIGKCKQILLKSIEKEDNELPEYMNVENLYNYASENGWIEMQDIDLGDWCKTNLRDRAIESGIKDFYDKHYDFLSAFSHGQWGALRQTVFTTCMNPLHKLHIVPKPAPAICVESVHIEATKIMNLLLELLNQNYSPFKPRFKKHNQT